MKKNLLFVTTFAVMEIVALLVAPSALAFQAVLLPNQTLQVTQGEVLGKEDENRQGSGVVSSSPKMMTAEEYKKFEADYIKSHNISPQEVQARDARVAAERAKSATAVRPTPTVVNKDIRMSVEAGKGKMELIERRPASGSARPPEMGHSGNDRPQASPGQQFEDRFMKLEMPAGTSQNSGPGRGGEPVRQDGVTIQTPPGEDHPERLEMNVNDVRAKIAEPTAVTVDPESRRMTISGPNGEDRPLKILPDDAFDRMRAQTKLDPSKFDEVKANLELKTNDDGSISYESTSTENRKAFGFIPFKVTKKLSLDDATGAVQETESPSGFWASIFSRFGSN